MKKRLLDGLGSAAGVVIGLVLAKWGVSVAGWSVPQDPGSSTITADRVVTKELVILGVEGKPRAVLGTPAGGGILLEFRDEQQVPRVMLGLGPDGPAALQFTDAAGVKTSLGQSAEDGSYLALGKGGDGRPRVVLSSHNEHGLAVRDAHGETRCWLGLRSTGQSGLWAKTEGKTCASLVAFSEGAAALIGTDENQRTRLLLGVGEESAGLKICDAEGRPRVVARTMNSGEASLVMTDAAGKETWTAHSPARNPSDRAKGGQDGK